MNQEIQVHSLSLAITHPIRPTPPQDYPFILERAEASAVNLPFLHFRNHSGRSVNFVAPAADCPSSLDHVKYR